MGIRRWKMPTVDQERSARLAQATGLSGMAAAVLAARGLGQEQALCFAPQAGELHDPFLMRDMDRAAQRLTRAVDQGELVAVYGDYDCDGITATAMLYSYLQDMGARVMYYIPDRDGEGYGLNSGAIQRLHQAGVGLIVTVDNGISALEEVDYAASLGMEVIVTDHHQPRETLPRAAAVLNPHRRDCTYPFPHLCGVGVAFKLICAMEGDLGCQEMLCHYGALAAIGTVADVVELTGENRAIVQSGLESLQNRENLGLNALLEAAGCGERELDSIGVAFGLAPRINAAGRMGRAMRAVELLLCEDEEEAETLAQEIDGYNSQRKELVEQIVEEIALQLEEHPETARQRVVVLWGEGWHHGVIGIAASKVVERYGKPCILIAVNGEEARGSARSVEGYSIIQAISRCSGLLTRYGGHDQAAGFSLAAKDIPAFARELLEDAAERFDLMPSDSLSIDLVLPREALTLETVEELRQLEPFGCGNEAPVAALLGCRIERVIPLSEGRHLRLRLSQRGKPFHALYFGMPEASFPFREGEMVDVAAGLDINEYNGERSVSVKVKELRLSGINQDKLVTGRQYYEKYLRREPLSRRILDYITPQREDIAQVYRFLRQEQGYPFGYDQLWCRLGGMNYCKMMLCVDVMEELGLLRRESAGGEPALCLNPAQGKTDLNRSGILAGLREGELR